jgi:hypothetical protein
MKAQEYLRELDQMTIAQPMLDLFCRKVIAKLEKEERHCELFAADYDDLKTDFVMLQERYLNMVAHYAVAIHKLVHCRDMMTAKGLEESAKLVQKWIDDMDQNYEEAGK